MKDKATLHNNLIEHRITQQHPCISIDESFYRMGVHERRMLLFVIAKAVPDHRTATIPNTIEISVSEMYKHVFPDKPNIKSGMVYNYAKEAATNLARTEITFINPETGNLVDCCWFSAREYKQEEGTIEVEISQKLKPVLVGFKEKYTVIDIATVGRINGTYPIRIYEYLKSKASLKKYIMPLANLRDIFQIPTGKFPRFANINAKIIKPSLKQINEQTDIDVAYKKANTGRRWTHIEFTIKPNKQNLKKQTVKLEANPLTEIEQPQSQPEEYEFIEPIAALAAYANKDMGVDGNEIVKKV